MGIRAIPVRLNHLISRPETSEGSRDLRRSRGVRRDDNLSQGLHTFPPTSFSKSPPPVCISKTFSRCLLRVVLFSPPVLRLGPFNGGPQKKRRGGGASILTCSRMKVKGDGGLPSPWQRSSTVSPSLTRPWGDSFHSSTTVVGSGEGGGGGGGGVQEHKVCVGGGWGL